MSKDIEDEDLSNATLYHEIFEVGIKDVVLMIPKHLEERCKLLNLGVKIIIDDRIPEDHWFLVNKKAVK